MVVRVSSTKLRSQIGIFRFWAATAVILIANLTLPLTVCSQTTGQSKKFLSDLLESDQIQLSAIPKQTEPSAPVGLAKTNLDPSKLVNRSDSSESVSQYLRSDKSPRNEKSSAQFNVGSLESRSNRSQPATFHHSPTTGSTYQLQHTSMLQFEELLIATYGQSLQVELSADGRIASVSMPSGSSQPLSMKIDRHTGLLTYHGASALQTSWLNLMAQLDAKHSNLNTSPLATQVAYVFPTNTNLETIQQTAFMLGLLQDTDRIQLPGNFQDQPLPKLDGQPQGKVTITQDPNTGVIQITAENAADREMVERYIKALNEIVKGRQKQPKAFPLKNAQAATIETRVKELYDSAYAPSYGTIEVKANALNNSLVVVGLPEALQQMESIIAQFDTAVVEDPRETLKTFNLKYISAVDAKVRLDTFFGQNQQGLGSGENRLPSIPIVTIPDYRSNILTVKGSQQSIKEAELFLAAIDVDKADAYHEIKVIKIRNRLAADLAVIVQDALNGQLRNAGKGFQGGGQQQQNQQLDQQQQNQQDVNTSRLSSKGLVMEPTSAGEQSVSSGILFDVRVSADRESNSLIISAPANSMDLIEKLISELDRVPDVEVQMKVFHIENGDAVELLNTLNSLFTGSQQQQTGGFGQQDFGQQNFGSQGNLFNQLPLQTAGSTPGSNLVNIRFSADPRTNSIIATGPIGELQVVEALLNRLDENRVSNMITRIYRVSNAPVLDLADTITQWIAGRDDINSIDPSASGNFNQSYRRVVVVPEVVSNCLLVQAHPDFMDEVIEAIKAFDRRPPMVKVKVLLAEIDLNRLEEFGLDVGLQDSILFDRGTTIGAGNLITGGIGFPFNGPAVANANTFGRENVAGQVLSNLGTGRTNNDVGYGGLVLSAGNESISFLLRALKNKRCLRVLSKPQIMTMENLKGTVKVGANVPRVAGVVNNGLTVTQDIVFEDVGVILEVTPRVSPDGMIVIIVNASRSSVGPEESGTTVGVGADGTPIRAPFILQTNAQTTLMTRSGQTVVFGGLIQETKSHEERGIPILSDLPVVGPLFKFESDQANRTELLVILTPYLITGDEDIEQQNQEEMDRVHWCLEDVSEIYGSTGHQVYDGTQDAVETIYPYGNPTEQSKDPSTDPRE